MKNDTLGERISKKLKDDILSGVYAPGERLLYEKVAENLGVSMTPLKAALLKLEQEGLVKNVARRGTFVAQLTERDVMEYSQIRMALESLAVDLACAGDLITPKKLAKLTDINDQIEKAIRKNSPREVISYDIQFHLSLIGLSENSRLIELMNQFPLGNFLLIMGRGDKGIENGELILNDHIKIIDALRQKDIKLLKELLEVNIFLPYNQIFQEK